MIIQLFYSTFLSLQIEDFETATETEIDTSKRSRKILFKFLATMFQDILIGNF